jgi:hypothetical protein
MTRDVSEIDRDMDDSHDPCVADIPGSVSTDDIEDESYREEVRQIEIIPKSALLVGLTDVAAAIDEADFDAIQWGYADHTLISVDRFIDEIVEVLDTGEYKKQWDELRNRIDWLDSSVLVDLET